MANADLYGNIEHSGIVKSSDDKSVTVSISSRSACAGCHAEGSCSVSGSEEKIIDIPGFYEVVPGDFVTVIMKKSMGFMALFLGYVLPVIIMTALLILLLSLSVTELTAALAAVVVLLPYYLILYFARKHIDKKFTFILKTDR
jgi:sigma-E factor negative regulatory protein RseC